MGPEHIDIHLIVGHLINFVIEGISLVEIDDDADCSCDEDNQTIPIIVLVHPNY